MKCKQCTEDLTAYLDGELDGNAFVEVESHLRNCPPCLGELESLRRSSALVESHLEEIELRPQTWDRLQATIAAGPALSRRSGLWAFLHSHRWVAAGAALAASVVMGAGTWGIWSYRHSERMLRHYMDEYVQRRDYQEHHLNASLTSVSADAGGTVHRHSEYADNPFVDSEDEETDNPFRSEAR